MVLNPAGRLARRRREQFRSGRSPHGRRRVPPTPFNCSGGDRLVTSAPPGPGWCSESTMSTCSTNFDVRGFTRSCSAGGQGDTHRPRRGTASARVRGYGGAPKPTGSTCNRFRPARRPAAVRRFGRTGLRRRGRTAVEADAGQALYSSQHRRAGGCRRPFGTSATPGDGWRAGPAAGTGRTDRIPLRRPARIGQRVSTRSRSGRRWTSRRCGGSRPGRRRGGRHTGPVALDPSAPGSRYDWRIRCTPRCGAGARRRPGYAGCADSRRGTGVSQRPDDCGSSCAARLQSRLRPEARPRICSLRLHMAPSGWEICGWPIGRGSRDPRRWLGPRPYLLRAQALSWLLRARRPTPCGPKLSASVS